MSRTYQAKFIYLDKIVVNGICEHIPAIEAKLNAVGTLVSASTAALAAAIPSATLGIRFKPVQMEASIPPTKQSPAPVSLTVTTDAGEMHNKKMRISFQICSTKPMWMRA